MLGAAVLLAGALAPVTVPSDVQRRLFSTYPTWAVQQGKSSATLMEAIVEPDGKVRECKVVEFVGNERLATEECTALARRKLRPATGPDGQPILGLFRTNISRYLQGHTPEVLAVRNWSPPPDLTVAVEQPSGEGEGRHDVGLAIFVRDDGSVAACAGIAPTNEREAVPAGLVEAACSEVTKLRRAVLTTAAGEPTAYVANISVRFETPAAA